MKQGSNAKYGAKEVMKPSYQRFRVTRGLSVWHTNTQRISLALWAFIDLAVLKGYKIIQPNSNAPKKSEV